MSTVAEARAANRPPRLVAVCRGPAGMPLALALTHMADVSTPSAAAACLLVVLSASCGTTASVGRANAGPASPANVGQTSILGVWRGELAIDAGPARQIWFDFRGWELGGELLSRVEHPLEYRGSGCALVGWVHGRWVRTGESEGRLHFRTTPRRTGITGCEDPTLDDATPEVLAGDDVSGAGLEIGGTYRLTDSALSIKLDGSPDAIVLRRERQWSPNHHDGDPRDREAGSGRSR
jgi:hypothetical protein